MRLGIDWVSAAIFLLALLFAQLRGVPIHLRYGGLAAACGAIALYRLRMGASGNNLIFVGLAAAFALYYAVKTFTSLNRREPD